MEMVAFYHIEFHVIKMYATKKKFLVRFVIITKIKALVILYDISKKVLRLIF